MAAFLDRIVGRLRRKQVVEDSKEQSPVYTKDLLVGPLFEIGDYTYGCPNVMYWDDNIRLHIGRFCSIADGVTILLGGNHRMDWVTTYPFPAFPKSFPHASGIQGHPASKGDVWIGNDVWIGRGATILSGVHVGDGAVIGTNALVAKDVEPYAIVVGNPGRTVKKRFDEQTINALLKIGWWNWNEEKINKELQYLCSDNIQEFIEKNVRTCENGLL